MTARPFPLHPAFVSETGSAAAGILLTKCVHWSCYKREHGSDGWFWKTRQQWEEETGLKRSSQETARRRLRDQGYLEERYQGRSPRTVHFRVCLDRLLQNETLRPLIRVQEIPQAALDFSDPQITQPEQPPPSQRTQMDADDSDPLHPPDPRPVVFAVAPSPLVSRLMEAGVTECVARDLAAAYPHRVERQLDWILFRKAKDSSAALIRSIEQDWAEPKGARDAREKALRDELERIRIAERQAEAQQASVDAQTDAAQIAAIWAALCEAQRNEVEQTARERVAAMNHLYRERMAAGKFNHPAIRAEIESTRAALLREMMARGDIPA